MQDYMVFAQNIISVVVGKKKFEARSSRSKFSSYVTVSDKAFTFLLFENNYEQWRHMGKTNNWATSHIQPL